MKLTPGRRAARRAAAGPLPKRPVLPEGKAQGEPLRPFEKVVAAVAAGDWHQAFRRAVKLSLGEDKAAIERGWEALTRPAFVRELGRDPEVMIEAGKVALRRRFGPKGAT